MGESKPRPLGNRARQIVDEADWELAAAFQKLADARNGVPILRAEMQLVASQVSGHVSEARRMLAEVKRLGLGTGPLGKVDEP